MERVIPYDGNFRLGYGMDVTKFPLQSEKRLISQDVQPISAQPNFTTAQFSFVESMKDVCDVLGIPPEYALKVQAGVVSNPVVRECLQDVGKQNLITVVFRITFLHQKVYLPCDAKWELGSGDACAKEGDTSEKKEEEENATATSVDLKAEGFGTHWVSALEVGNELVVILKISSPDSENFQKFFSSIKESLKVFKGILEPPVLLALDKFASSMDKKLKKKHYQDVTCRIRYGGFSEQDKYVASLTGMVNTIQGFMDRAKGWEELFKSGGSTQVHAGTMSLKDGVEEEKKGVIDRFSDFLTKDSSETDPKVAVGPSQVLLDVDQDHDSFVVLASETDHMFYMRVTLQSDQPEDSEIESFTSFALSQYPETSRDRFEKLFKVLTQVEKAISKLQRLFTSNRFLCEDRVVEGNAILRSVQNVHLEVHEAIKNLDMVTMPTEEFVESLVAANPLQTVNNYIENVMSKLPPGCDLDLLMIGKTGHGKSSTGNAILGQEKFVASASGDSVTRSSAVAWGNVDGRIIKVVDTPGVCDTSEEMDSIDLAIQAISEAISQCQGGFHAMLLVIRFGQRMTMEERKAIGMLKCILGENVIKSHCICVITHGDNFHTEMDGKKSFPQWCSEQSGFLKDLFEECQYRCVLFNNKSKDPRVLKGQLIQLVAKVDSLKSSGTRYTNALFEFAQGQRQRIISEGNVPQVSHEMMRDIELVLDHLKRIAHNTAQREKYAQELENLRHMVENLGNRVTEVEGDQVKLLVETVFSLAEVIHGEIDKIADKASPDPPDESPGHHDDDAQPASLQFQAQTENLENFRDQQITTQAQEVDIKVTEEVAKKIRAEEKCFPGNGHVIVEGGRVKVMQDLEVGDKVLVRDAKGVLCFDTVYMFGHIDPSTVAEFVVLHVGDDDKCVTVSDNHLVFCVRDGQEMSVSAKDVRIQDKLLLTTLPNLSINLEPVVGVTRQRHRGLFAPFTKTGTIIVDGAVMSCYVDVLPHATSHALLSPVRQLYCISPSTLAFVNGVKTGKAVPGWAKLALKWV